MKTFSIPLLVSLFVWGCSPKPSPTAFTVSDVMDDVITRLYREVPAQHYDTLSDKFLLGFLTSGKEDGRKGSDKKPLITFFHILHG